MIQVEAIAALLRDDLDGDGEITESDFVLLMLTKLKSKPEPYVLKLLRAQFCVLDATGDGTLTKAVGRVRLLCVMSMCRVAAQPLLSPCTVLVNAQCRTWTRQVSRQPKRSEKRSRQKSEPALTARRSRTRCKCD